MLPGEDSLFCCRRCANRTARYPIIMLTAKGDEGSRIQGLELGADDYLAVFDARTAGADQGRAAPPGSFPSMPGAPAVPDKVVTFGGDPTSCSSPPAN